MIPSKMSFNFQIFIPKTKEYWRLRLIIQVNENEFFSPFHPKIKLDLIFDTIEKLSWNHLVFGFRRNQFAVILKIETQEDFLGFVVYVNFSLKSSKNVYSKWILKVDFLEGIESFLVLPSHKFQHPISTKKLSNCKKNLFTSNKHAYDVS